MESFWEKGRSAGEVVDGTACSFKTRTVQRKAYEHRWRKENLDMVERVPWKTSRDGGEEEAIMPAIDIGMEMPEVEIPSVPTENQRPITRRLYIKARDIERHGATVNCKGCVATLREQGGHRHVPNAADR